MSGQDEREALEHRYNVTRTDGRSAPGEKHHGCRYFVLDLTHDPKAQALLDAYFDHPTPHVVEDAASLSNDEMPRYVVDADGDMYQWAPDGDGIYAFWSPWTGRHEPSDLGPLTVLTLAPDDRVEDLRAAAERAIAQHDREVAAKALRDHRRRVSRFMPAGLVDRATVLADLDDYADRIERGDA